ncbi:MAG: hypothetical protein F6J90_15405 [Moorea sp. SIOASIH]|nr:hypothetical protein [Moorena sp. SIOASIH]
MPVVCYEHLARGVERASCRWVERASCRWVERASCPWVVNNRNLIGTTQSKIESLLIRTRRFLFV